MPRGGHGVDGVGVREREREKGERERREREEVTSALPSTRHTLGYARGM